MKAKALSLVASLFFAFSSAFSADIPITGESMIMGTADYTFYATPVAQGATYTWNVYSGTIVAQNTDPAAGSLYVTIRWTTPGLYQDYVEIADNQGNFGSHGVYVGINPFAINETYRGGENVQRKEGMNYLVTCMYDRPEAVYTDDRKPLVRRQAA